MIKLVMRTYKDLLKVRTYEPLLDVILIGYTKIFIYENLDKQEEVFYSPRISLLFKLMMYDDYLLLWFDSFYQMYQELDEYLELEKDNFIKIIVIID